MQPESRRAIGKTQFPAAFGKTVLDGKVFCRIERPGPGSRRGRFRRKKHGTGCLGGDEARIHLKGLTPCLLSEWEEKRSVLFPDGRIGFQFWNQLDKGQLLFVRKRFLPLRRQYDRLFRLFCALTGKQPCQAESKRKNERKGSFHDTGLNDTNIGIYIRMAKGLFF